MECDLGIEVIDQLAERLDTGSILLGPIHVPLQLLITRIGWQWSGSQFPVGGLLLRSDCVRISV